MELGVTKVTNGPSQDGIIITPGTEMDGKEADEVGQIQQTFCVA